MFIFGLFNGEQVALSIATSVSVWGLQRCGDGTSVGNAVPSCFLERRWLFYNFFPTTSHSQPHLYTYTQPCLTPGATSKLLVFHNDGDEGLIVYSGYSHE